MSLGFLPTSPASAEPVTSLNRKPGLWSLTVITDGKDGLGAVRQCIDASTDARMLQMASQSEIHNCTKQELVREGSQYIFNSVCAFSGSKMVSKAVFRGDFGAKYDGEVVTRFDPPLFGRSDSKSIIHAKWIGACPSNMKPGDMQLPNGMKMSLEQAQQTAKMGAQVMSNPELARMMKGAMSNPAVRNAIKQMGGMGQK